MKTILVTGASGFIGSDILRELQNDYGLIALGRNFKKKEPHTNIHYVTGDLNQLNLDDIRADLPTELQIDVCIHSAGQAHIAQTGNADFMFMRNNIDATIAVLHLALEAKVSKFVLISSVVVYNNDPSDIYEQSKRKAEEYVTAFCKQHQITFIIIRPTMVYGKNEPSRYFADLINKMGRGYYLLPNSGNKIMNMVYIKNVSFIIRKTLEWDSYNNSIIVARDHEQLTLREWCSQLKGVINKECYLIPIPTLIVKILIIAINLVQKIGLLKRFKVRSLRNLNTQVQYPLSVQNASLVAALPYTAQEGMADMGLITNK
ncbi:NAD-dependent epimerase/dehydratase family protein [Paenibacillus periandrae]|uniref:NAD-dependent epimerase/dehydratase family protein n=1 Tax=Paenibacillus periandrae TaxID=1761741 RepID=UPI001F090223|nr:NAD(P)-dependent oxidoreductase [Paenibacillus periandrae]